MYSIPAVFARGFGAGAAGSGINYLSDLLDNRQSVMSGVDAGGTSGITRGAVSPYEMQRDPRKGCGSASPFTPNIGYSSAKGYQYSAFRTESVRQSQKKGFSLKDFALQTIMGGVIGGVASVGFYGAGKGIEKLKESFQLRKSGRYSVGDAAFMDAEDAFVSNISRRTDVDANRYFDVIAHGTPNGIQITHNGRAIRLLSCITGALDDLFMVYAKW